jgi:hypothetical protein
MTPAHARRTVHTRTKVKPRTAVSLLLGIVGACLSATVVVVALDATRPAVTAPSVAQPSVAQPSQSFVIPDDPLGNSSNVTVITSQSADSSSSITVITSRTSSGSTTEGRP